MTIRPSKRKNKNGLFTFHAIKDRYKQFGSYNNIFTVYYSQLSEVAIIKIKLNINFWCYIVLILKCSPFIKHGLEPFEIILGWPILLALCALKLIKEDMLFYYKRMINTLDKNNSLVK